MSIQTKETLKSYFESGDKPTESNFADLVDSLACVKLTINNQTDDYTAVLSDAADMLVELEKATDINFTIPPNSSVAFGVGAFITFIQKGAGQVSVVAGSGVTINSADSALKTRVQYSSAALIKVATDTWLLIGDITV